MPPQPPEETSLADADPRMSIHPKDPLAFSAGQSLHSKRHGRGASLSIDYSLMAPSSPHSATKLDSPIRSYGHNRTDSNKSSGYGSPVTLNHNQSLTATGWGLANGSGFGTTLNSSTAATFTTNTASSTPAALATLSSSSSTIPTTAATNAPVATIQQRNGHVAHHSMSSIILPAELQPSMESNVNGKRGGHHHHHHHHHQVNTTFQPGNLHGPTSAYQGAAPPYSPYSPYSPSHSPSPVNNSPYYSPLSSHPNQDRSFSALDRQQVVDPYSAPSAVLAAVNAQSTKNGAGVATKFGLKAAHVSSWKKLTWVAFTMGIFLMPYAILKACFHVQVSAGAWQTSVTYGMLMALDFMAVISFSALNRRSVNTRIKKRDPQWVGMTTGIVAVGYREDPILLEGCLKSLRAMRYQRNQRVLLVVDGNEAQDEYMADIFQKVFEQQGSLVLRPDFLCMDREASDKGREDLVRQIAYHPGPVCVMQPHRGKRAAMYTGFAALLQQGIETVVVTDSDTFLDPQVCRELAFALAESPIVGAATGDVRIYNTGTWVSFLSSLRYWFAFNLERGAQSYHSVVNCVSGPLGIYRMSIISEVMDTWVKQQFLGVLCTYGDDRHLTNLVLKEGYKVKFSHYAICYTDTPINFIAWVTQQTRWSKSFFREIPIQLGCMHLHSPWMTYALVYQLVYPMMMIYNLVNCIYFGTGPQISWWLVSIAFVGILKTAYALRITGDKKFFFTTAYGLLYMLGYVPAKIYAALTLYDNSWGTSARLIRNFTQIQNYVAPVTWALILSAGVFHNPSRYFEKSPVPIGQNPPLFTDSMVLWFLALFGAVYFFVFIWAFVRTGILERDYKRDFSYEELYESMSTYAHIEGGKRKVARFEV